MEWAAHNTQGDMRVNMRCQGEMNTLVESLTSRVKTVEDRISEMEDKLHNTIFQHNKLEKNLKKMN